MWVSNKMSVYGIILIIHGHGSSNHFPICFPPSPQLGRDESIALI